MSPEVPTFQVDPFWPKPLPESWVLGQCSGVCVDANDNLWMIHRRDSLIASEAGKIQDPPISAWGEPAPSILQFDPEGNLLQAWGGTDGGPWPVTEHGMYIDHEGNVWSGANGPDDQVVLKSKPDGTRLMTLGEWGKTGGSNDTKLLGRPADITVDAEANEVYLADGYGNRRIIVFDATSGVYKRHWGAYGTKTPTDDDLGPVDPDAEPLKSFRTPVHAVRISNDGLVYVCDRRGDRIQVFEKDGNFIKEVWIEPRTLGNGSCWDIDFSVDPAQTFMYVADGTNGKVWIMNRTSLEIVGSFGRKGRWAGCFEWLHNVCADSRGNLYTAEVNTGKRIQKFVQTS